MLLSASDLSAREKLILAQQSPSAFTSFVLGVDQAGMHVALQTHLSQHDDCQAEFPRGHGKTTQVAARVAFEIGRNPDIRVKYVQQSDIEAARTTEYVKLLIESERYRMVFPHIRPDRRLWGKQEFRVQRKRLGRDATVQAAGIFGRAGGRWDLLIGDDICDLRNSVQQPALRLQVKEFWANNWAPMADETADERPRVWTVDTPWHVDDIASDWRAYHAERGSLLRCPVIDYVSPWPEAWDADRLRAWREKHGPVAYARAYELEPVSSETLIFPAEWLDASLYKTIPAWEAANGQMVARFDFAFTEKKLDNDPDWSVCLIGWQSRNGHVWLRDIVRERSSFPVFARKAIERCEHHGVEAARGEGNGPQAGLVQQLNRDAPFPVTPVERDRDKVTRAAERQSFVESGRFHLLAEEDEVGVLRPTRAMQVIYDEMTTFPASGHDDTVDAAIDIMDVVDGSSAPIKVSRFTSPVTDLSRRF